MLLFSDNVSSFVPIAYFNSRFERNLGDCLEDYLFRAPALRLEVGQFAKVKAESGEWRTFDNSFRPNEKENRLPIRVLEGEDTGLLKTIRTRSDDLVFQTVDIAKKTDVKGLEFWIQKKEKTNKKGNAYTFFCATPSKPSLKG